MPGRTGGRETPGEKVWVKLRPTGVGWNREKPRAKPDGLWEKARDKTDGDPDGEADPGRKAG